ncbi:MAG: aminotransferase class IV [Treponema sp.]|jgi:D-alanine transaminase|nr:aminotransferase class IV [Treponema sp.]
MKTLGYYNGEIGEIDEMHIPMNDRVCWFGDGVYDAAIAANYIVFTLDEHIDRFFNSARLMEMTVPVSKAGLAELLRSLVQKLESPTQFVYWQLTRGTADRAHRFPVGKGNLWVMLRPLVLPDLGKKIRLITVEDTRFFHCNIKTLNLLPNVMAAEKAERAGAEEVVFHRGDRVTECAHSNVHILKDGILRTAPTDNLILPGVARAHIIRHCKKLSIGVEERAFTLKEMMTADEVFISACSTFCAFADHIDGIPVGGKAPELEKRLRDSLIGEFREECGL